MVHRSAAGATRYVEPARRSGPGACRTRSRPRSLRRRPRTFRSTGAEAATRPSALAVPAYARADRDRRPRLPAPRRRRSRAPPRRRRRRRRRATTPGGRVSHSADASRRRSRRTAGRDDTDGLVRQSAIGCARRDGAVASVIAASTASPSRSSIVPDVSPSETVGRVRAVVLAIAPYACVASALRPSAAAETRRSRPSPERRARQSRPRRLEPLARRSRRRCAADARTRR